MYTSDQDEVRRRAIEQLTQDLITAERALSNAIGHSLVVRGSVSPITEMIQFAYNMTCAAKNQNKRSL